MPDGDAGYASLWDWRRRIGSMYAAVRHGDGGQAAWVAWRAERDALFRSHPQSPVARGEFTVLPYFPYDPALRFAVGLSPAVGAPLLVPAGEDGTVRLQPFALTQGLIGAFGRELTVFWVEGYGGGAFLPFADATSGRETYGGGRYLLDTIKGADLGTDGVATVLDFNYAYNPSCSYSDQYICPLAPDTNRIAVAIRAGERQP